MKIKKLIKYLVLAMIIGLFISGCSSKKVYKYSTFKQEKPFFDEMFNEIDNKFQKYKEVSFDYATNAYEDKDSSGIGPHKRNNYYARKHIDMNWASGVISRYMDIYIKKRFNVIKHFNISSGYLTSRKKTYERLNIYIIGDGSVSLRVFYTNYSGMRGLDIDMETIISDLEKPYTQYLSKDFNKDYLYDINLLIDKEYKSSNRRKEQQREIEDRVEERARVASKRSWNAILGGINAGLSTTTSDWNKINNNINNSTSTRSTPKRWQDMSESEKKVEAENYKYLKASEVKKDKSSIKQQENKSENTDNKSTTRYKSKSRYGDCYHYCEGISGKIHDKSTPAGACEKGCSLKHWLSNSEKAHSKCKENFGVGGLAQECHEAVKRY
jgi:hypothetical protein